MSLENHIRPPAVAGMFYPNDAAMCQEQVDHYLHEGTYENILSPKAIIVPHAGYIYSASIAASAFRSIQPNSRAIKRVVLLGPAHRVPLGGMAVPGVDFFQTPLGDVQLDTNSMRLLVDKFPQVKVSDLAHQEEHSLEVQLPFLQTIIPEFTLIPLVVGDATEIEVAAVLQHLWGEDDCLIVISSDLSHFHSYHKAVKLDNQTAQAIEALRGGDIHDHAACGRIPIAGLLRVARQGNMRIQRFDLRNSGDTGGDKDRVVGYGAWGVFQS